MSSLGRARWENAVCYKPAATVYGSVKLQNQGKESVLPHQLRYLVHSKSRGGAKVTWKHIPTSPALASPSPLQCEPGQGLSVSLRWMPGLAPLPDIPHRILEAVGVDGTNLSAEATGVVGRGHREPWVPPQNKFPLLTRERLGMLQ